MKVLPEVPEMKIPYRHPMISKALMLLAFTLAFMPASAQRRGRGFSQLSSRLAEYNALNDSIKNIGQTYSTKVDSLIAAHDFGMSQNAKSAQLTNPYFFPLFAGNTLLQRPLTMSIGSLSQAFRPQISLTPSHLETMARAISTFYAENPSIVIYNLTSTPIISEQTNEAPIFEEKNNTEMRQEASQAANTPIEIQKNIITEPEILDLSDFHIHIRRPNFWKVKGSFSTQFMQYYVSENWYKGGSNYVSMLGIFNIEANYDNKQRLTFSNKLETKLGFQTSPNDEYHKFKTNSDLLRMTNKLGIQAHKHWYYSMMLQTWTQFYKAYKANSADISSNFMSPFESVLSIGMDYKLDKKHVNFNVNIAPGALDYRYCNDKSLIGSHIKDGAHPDRHYKIDFGSTLTANMTLKVCQQVNWVSRFYVFYNYKTIVDQNRDQIKWEWENTINLKVNKYLSAKIFLYPRYEGGLKKNRIDPETGETIGTRNKIQFNEFLSVGFDINF